MAGAVKEGVVPQPDSVMTASMGNVPLAPKNLDPMDRVRDIPGLDRAQILAEIKVAMSEAVEKGFRPEAVEKGFGPIIDAFDYNARARLANCAVSGMANASLTPLRTPRNEDVKGLPRMQSGIEDLSSEKLNRILQLYGLKADGGVWARREELRRYLGIRVAVPFP